MASTSAPTPAGGWSSAWRVVEPDLRRLSAAVVAGLLLGFVVVGWGSRLAMMLLARLNPEVTGRLSDDGFVMGQFILGQTMGLVLFGTAVGVLGSLVYLALRPLRFGPPWFSLTALTVGPAVVVGNLLVHTDGVDFRTLEPVGLSIALFVLLPGVYALATVGLVERWLRPGAWFATAPGGWAAAFLLPALLAVAVVAAVVLGADVTAAGSAVRWVGRSVLVVVFAISLWSLAGKVVELT